MLVFFCRKTDITLRLRNCLYTETPSLKSLALVCKHGFDMKLTDGAKSIYIFGNGGKFESGYWVQLSEKDKNKSDAI